MKTKKLLVLVMTSSNPHYKDLENSIKDTWFNLKNDDVEIIFYSDNQSEVDKKNYPFLQDNNLILPCNDGYYYCGVKTVMALDWVLQNYDFEYIYRSNLGAFVYPDKLIKFLEEKPKSKFYCGIIGEDTFHLGRKVRFASGSGYFLSKDLVQLLSSKKNEFIYQSVDDVAMGEFMSRYGISIQTSAVRYNMCDNNFNYQVGDKEVSSISEDEIYHIRLRSDDRKLDIQRMKEIYKKNN